MSPKLKELLEQVENLAPDKQQQLLNQLAAWLNSHSPAPTSGQADSFWNPKPLEAYLSSQQIKTTTVLKDLVASFWPQDESADDINAFVQQMRRHDLQSGQ